MKVATTPAQSAIKNVRLRRIDLDSVMVFIRCSLRLSSDFPLSQEPHFCFARGSFFERCRLEVDALSINLITPHFRNFHVVNSLRLHLTCSTPRRARNL